MLLGLHCVSDLEYSELGPQNSGPIADQEEQNICVYPTMYILKVGAAEVIMVCDISTREIQIKTFTRYQNECPVIL